MFTKVLTRPALALVTSILLLFVGVLGIKTLPIEQFPAEGGSLLVLRFVLFVPVTIVGFAIFLARYSRSRR